MGQPKTWVHVAVVSFHCYATLYLFQEIKLQTWISHNCSL